MASTTYYFTDAAFTALSGYNTGDTATEECELGDAADSGSLGPYTLDKSNSHGRMYVAAYPSAVHDDNDWTALPAAGGLARNYSPMTLTRTRLGRRPSNSP